MWRFSEEHERVCAHCGKPFKAKTRKTSYCYEESCYKSRQNKHFRAARKNKNAAKTESQDK